MSWSMLASAAAESITTTTTAQHSNWHGHAAQRATAKMQHATAKMQHATAKMQRATVNITCNGQDATCNGQYNVQRPKMQHATAKNRTCRERADDHCEQHDADHDRCRREEYLRITHLTRNDRSAASPIDGVLLPVALWPPQSAPRLPRLLRRGSNPSVRGRRAGRSLQALPITASGSAQVSRRYHGSARQRLRARPSCRRRS
jgi:hypothetical protein